MSFSLSGREQAVLTWLRAEPRQHTTVTFADLEARFRMDRNVVSFTLSKLTRLGFITRVHRGVYRAGTCEVWAAEDGAAGDPEPAAPTRRVAAAIARLRDAERDLTETDGLNDFGLRLRLGTVLGRVREAIHLLDR